MLSNLPPGPNARKRRERWSSEFLPRIVHRMGGRSKWNFRVERQARIRALRGFRTRLDVSSGMLPLNPEIGPSFQDQH